MVQYVFFVPLYVYKTVCASIFRITVDFAASFTCIHFCIIHIYRGLFIFFPQFCIDNAVDCCYSHCEKPFKNACVYFIHAIVVATAAAVFSLETLSRVFRRWKNCNFYKHTRNEHARERKEMKR